MADVIDAVERGFREYKAGKCVVPVRMPVKIEKAEGVFLFMPAYLEKEGFFGTKIVSVFPRNVEKKLSTIQAAYLLNDPTTGELLALMDGILLTAMRTGATSALATKYLSRKNSEPLGSSASAQAPFQAEAISKVRPIHRMLVYDKDRKIAENSQNRLE
jgi:ornithine cyclodeaminase/alanine dehydrogenase-like protein (mu-crystallin family)